MHSSGHLTRVDLGQLASASRTEKRMVTSTPEVPGPSRSWSPAPAAPSSPLDLRTRLYRRGYLRRKDRRARLSWAKAPWRCDRGAQANDLLPARAEALPAGDPAVRWCWAVQDRQVRRRPSSAGSTGAWDAESMAPKYMRRAHFKACCSVTVAQGFFPYAHHGRGKAAPSVPPHIPTG